MNLAYEKNEDYQITMLQMDEQPEGTLTKYGLMRKNYLKKYKNGVYTGLLLKGKLTEQLKAEKQMLWVQKMNNIRYSAEETVLTELIYS